MVFVDLLCVRNRTVDIREVELSDAHESLKDKQDGRDESEDGVGAVKVWKVHLDLIDLDDNQTGHKSKNTGAIEHRVDDGALMLLRCRVGRLKYQSTLGE